MWLRIKKKEAKCKEIKFSVPVPTTLNYSIHIRCGCHRSSALSSRAQVDVHRRKSRESFIHSGTKMGREFSAKFAFSKFPLKTFWCPQCLCFGCLLVDGRWESLALSCRIALQNFLIYFRQVFGRLVASWILRIFGKFFECWKVRRTDKLQSYLWALLIARWFVWVIGSFGCSRAFCAKLLIFEGFRF